MMDAAQIAAAAGTFIGACVAAFFSRRSTTVAEKVQAEVEGPGDDPSLRQMLLDQNKVNEQNASKVAAEFARTHRETGAVLYRIEKLETRVGKLEEARRPK